jgi:uncharacterized protein YcfJ
MKTNQLKKVVGVPEKITVVSVSASAGGSVAAGLGAGAGFLVGGPVGAGIGWLVGLASGTISAGHLANKALSASKTENKVKKQEG